jgi:MerR family copper efflux transcriptional regulator
MLNIRVPSKVKDISAPLRIGELAQRTGVASTALRYYEKTGLIPSPQRTASGYRAYDVSVLPRLAFIRAAQAVGLTLAEIRDVIRIREGGSPPCSHVVDLIERHRAEIRARMRELQQLEQDLAHLARAGAQLNPAECDPAGICKVIPTDGLIEDRPHSPHPVAKNRRAVRSSPSRRSLAVTG